MNRLLLCCFVIFFGCDHQSPMQPAVIIDALDDILVEHRGINFFMRDQIMSVGIWDDVNSYSSEIHRNK